MKLVAFVRKMLRSRRRTVLVPGYLSGPYRRRRAGSRRSPRQG